MPTADCILYMSTSDFLYQISKASDQPLSLCYHCHKCTAGCPALAEMEYGPDQILHMIQLGEKERLLASRDIWLCASCETCGARCPNEIDLAPVMDVLRSMALAERAPIAEPEAAKFHRLFLRVLRHTGRMHEALLLGGYKLWTRRLLDDMDSGARMLLKGKLPLLPKLVKDRQAVKIIFEKTALKRQV